MGYLDKSELPKDPWRKDGDGERPYNGLVLSARILKRRESGYVVRYTSPKMGESLWVYVTGVVLCWIGSALNSLGNIFFTLNHRSENDKYKYCALGSFIFGGCSDAISLMLIPISIWSANCVMSIPISTLYAHCILEEPVNSAQILILVFITAFAGISSFAGNHGDGENPLVVFPTAIGSPAAISLLTFCIGLFIGVILYVRKHEERSTPRPVNTISVYDFCGSIIAAMCNVTSDVVTKISLVFITCLLSSGCKDKLGYIGSLILLPFVLMGQLKALQFMMNNFNVVTAVPIYTIVSIMLTNLFGIVLFEEYPRMPALFAICLLTNFALILLLMWKTSMTEKIAFSSLSTSSITSFSSLRSFDAFLQSPQSSYVSHQSLEDVDLGVIEPQTTFDMMNINLHDLREHGI